MDIILTKAEKEMYEIIIDTIKSACIEKQKRFDDILYGIQLKQLLNDMKSTSKEIEEKQPA